MLLKCPAKPQYRVFGTGAFFMTGNDGQHPKERRLMNMERQRISKEEVIYADPWGKKAKETTNLPDDAIFACAYEINLVIDQFHEAAFFRRTETADELWVGTGVPWFRPLTYGTASAEDFGRANLESIFCVFAVKRKGNEITACLRLIELFFRVRHGLGAWPEGFVAPGIVDKVTYDSLLARLENEYEENRKKARENEIELIRVARELGLTPYPTGKYPDQWAAHCPRRNHPIYITTTENYFFCGWCGRKGGVEELREFVKERRNQ